MKKLSTFLVLTLLFITVAGCSGDAADLVSAMDIAQPAVTSVGTVETTTTEQLTPAATAITVTAKFDKEDLDTSVNTAVMTTITLDGSAIDVTGEGAAVNGSNLIINAAGAYQLSGTLDDGQIIVDTLDAENVNIILDGVDITSLISAPIYVANAEKVILTLAAGSQNFVTDGNTYANLDEGGEPNAAIFSKDDLTINGEGALTVNANYNNGIASKDDLKITGGTIMVNAVNDGIKGRDSLAIKDGLITVVAGADGLQANNDEDPEKGYVVIEGGILDITAGLDGVQAETSLLVSGGTLQITAGGGSVASSSNGFGGHGMEGNPNQTEESNKGLKAGIDLTI
jgi:hypothetical protein